MRVSQHIIGLLALFTAFIVYHFSIAFSTAWREHEDNQHGAALAEATAAWIDGQVALSLERSLSQVALARAVRDRPPLIAQIETQRRHVDWNFRAAFAYAHRADPTASAGPRRFIAEGARLRRELAAARADIDAHLAQATQDLSRRDAVVGELITLIDDAAVIREHLRIKSSGYNSYALALMEVQRLAWETREYAGRVRTPFAIATLDRTAIDSDDAARFAAQAAVARQAWATLKTIASHVRLPGDVVRSIRDADRRFTDSYQTMLDDMDDAFARAHVGVPDDIVSFDAFFEESSGTLAAIRQVAALTGEEIALHWGARVDASRRQLSLKAVVAVSATVFTLAFSIFVRRSLIEPIADATHVLTRVAAGDLDAKVPRARRELVEIAALHDSLESFRRSMAQAKRAEAEAKTDHLTGLPNRRHLEDWFADPERHRLNEGDAFAFIDLDEFKPINDTFGHDAGDAVLREIAERLRGFSGEDCEIWRLGGDEFGMVLRGLNGPDAHAFRADEILEAVCRPIIFGDDELFVAASIGLALYDNEILRADELLSRADMAMFTAKQRPVGKSEIYSKPSSSRRFGLESRREISTALQHKEFHPVYQPQYDLLDGSLTGFEALARWRRTPLNCVEPAEFFDMIEFFEMNAKFDLAIAEQVLSDMSRLHAEISELPQFSINISEEALASSETRRAYLALFSKYEHCTPRLTVEVTENALVDRSASAIRSTLLAFLEAGVKLSMDDFGTGYGSFRHLQEYRFHEVKIDKSFVQKMTSDRSAYVIIEGFLTIARGLDTMVVAEGVETEDQRLQLMRMGCPVGQGFLFSRPVHAAALPGLIQDGAATARIAG